MGLDEKNYGWYEDEEAHPFSQPRRFYYCKSCWKEKRREAREDAEEDIRSANRTAGAVAIALCCCAAIYALCWLIGAVSK